MGDSPIRSIVNIACAPPFACRAVAASRLDADDLAEQLASGLALRVHREDTELTIDVVEPLELVTVAREVARLGGSLRAFAATPGALELLVDAADSWQWLCATLDFEPRDDQRPFVASIEGGYHELDELADGYTFLERPLLVLGRIPLRRAEAPQIFDADEITIDSLDFERDARAWYVHDMNDRSVQINDTRIRSLHRVMIGDRVTRYGYGYIVLAII